MRHRVRREGHQLGRGRGQYSGNVGRTENWQIGVFAAYATILCHTLVDREFHLPKSWTEDRERCRAARSPGERGLATKKRAGPHHGPAGACLSAASGLGPRTVGAGAKHRLVFIDRLLATLVHLRHGATRDVSA
nr:transposase [Streptomyces sp. 3211]